MTDEKVERLTLERHIREVKKDIQDCKDFLQFAASTDLHYEQEQATLAGKQLELEKLQEVKKERGWE